MYEYKPMTCSCTTPRADLIEHNQHLLGNQNPDSIVLWFQDYYIESFRMTINCDLDQSEKYSRHDMIIWVWFRFSVINGVYKGLTSVIF